jgi:hypothetical protein
MQKHTTVLAIQDTTDLDFTHHPATKGLGPLEHLTMRGLKVHSVLCVSSDGVPLGLVHQEVWARDPKAVGKRHRRRKLETKDKESQRWLSALGATQKAIPEGVRVITVADREADMYDLFAAPRKGGVELLIRASHNRRVHHEARYLWDAIRSTPPCGQLVVELKRSDDRPPRQAQLTLRFASLEIEPPVHHRKRGRLKPILVQVVLAEEEGPPAGAEAVCWLLLTTLPVRSFEEAVQCVGWYTYRWLVERYHFVLKSGCRVEELQLEEAERIHNALASYCIVAWRLLWLTYEARRNPDASCETVLEAHEWQSLYCTVNKTLELPKRVPSLREAVRWTAQLGGFLGRRRDGEPGVKTIWRGLVRLHDIAATWEMLRPHSSTLVHT